MYEVTYLELDTNIIKTIEIGNEFDIETFVECKINKIELLECKEIV